MPHACLPRSSQKIHNIRVVNIIMTDFWTTKCTNCPDALDRLNDLAGEERYRNVKFVSICCDSCDGARNIIEKEDSPRWEKVSHFFMDHEHKEEVKQILGFKQVPFYVVLNKEGDIVQMGSKKHIDFEHLPGVIEPEKKDSSDKKDNGFHLDMDF